MSAFGVIRMNSCRFRRCVTTNTVSVYVCDNDERECDKLGYVCDKFCFEDCVLKEPIIRRIPVVAVARGSVGQDDIRNILKSSTEEYRRQWSGLTKQVGVA